MTLEEAIRTAIEYETRIRDVYREAEATVEDETGKKIFETLGNDEQHHIEYLEHTLDQWAKNGTIYAERLESIIPAGNTIKQEAAKIESLVAKEFYGIRKQMLSRALKAEIETSDFYRRLVEELPAEGKSLFSRFLEIENNHVNAVQFELDYMSKTGYWFDFKEFNME